MTASTDLTILAIIPVHNRKDTTLEMLASLEKIARPDGARLSVCVIDDGSTDGTAEAITAAYPDIHVVKSDGSLFWSGAVRLGIDRFLASDADFLWLLNDDLTINPACLTRMMAVAVSEAPAVISATVVDDTGTILYGGILRRPFFRFRKTTEADFKDGRCHADTVNGNCLLIRRAALAAFRLPPHGLYRQEGLDMYIGLEATRLGQPPVILRDATCRGAVNTGKFWFYRSGAPLRDRLRAFTGPKGLPTAMYWDLCRRFAGPLAPVYVLRAFARVIVPVRSKPPRKV